MKSARSGKRYLAGFVAAAAIVHVALMILESLDRWNAGAHQRAAGSFLLFGLVPAAASLALARKGWLCADERSADYSAAGLVILLAALLLSHLGWSGAQ